MTIFSFDAGDPAKLRKLIQDKLIDIENLNELSVDVVKNICEQCSIPTQQKSKVFN